MFSSGPGQSHTLSIFIDFIAKDLGVLTTSISFAYGFATAIAALALTAWDFLSIALALAMC